MPWQTPTLEQLRSINAANVTALLRSGPIVPNSILRVMADSNAGLAYLTLLYLNWLALQLMPDTAETEWLDRFGNIWVGGRKPASYASGTVLLSGVAGTLIPAGTLLTATTAVGVTTFQTTADVTLQPTPTTPVSVIAISSGASNVLAGGSINLSVAISGANAIATVSALDDGSPEETDDELRARLLDRIRQPPMGGDAFDYVQWALKVPGVTRAWCSPNEQGPGTIALRFMMDDKNNGSFYIDTNGNGHGGGFPEANDVATVAAALNAVRPVAVKDIFVEAPLPTALSFTVKNLSTSNATVQAAIIASVKAMLFEKASPAYSAGGVAQPAQTIYQAWISDAILQAEGVEYFDLAMTSDFAMPSNGYMAVLGTITFA